MTIRRIGPLKTVPEFKAYLNEVGVSLPFDEAMQVGVDAPLAQPYVFGDKVIGNRFAVLPLEGWDGTLDGRPTDLTRRRWERFGLSGAKMIWGGEASAVRPDGRGNPKQLMILKETVGEIAGLREILLDTHIKHFGTSDDLFIGLQLTHSGRFSRPNRDKGLEPKILYHHPILDKKFGLTPDTPVMTDAEISSLVDDFIQASVLAKSAGFDFVDIKHCHGYLGHEFLSAVDRPGRYGCSLKNRTRFLREIVEGIRTEAPGLHVGVRVSIFDFIPFQRGRDGRGEPVPFNKYRPAETRASRYAFGSDESGLDIDLAEPLALLDLLTELGIKLICISAGNPYHNPHIQRPALFPPSDGYLPPEDPLAGVARLIDIGAGLKQKRPSRVFVGSGYSYLQEWLPNVAQNVVRTGQTDFVGLGRMLLSYPEMPTDILEDRPLQRRKICRTFSDCTTAPRHGMVSGCYQLDDFYKNRPEFKELQKIKAKISQA
jgi:2,4-dienoyl-CoA reductase-like NADH-dependent reductase (Old Yellow Enzyme family)